MRHRIIPCLQLLNGSLVKTVQFKNPRYIGDPINTVRIFNELEVDELCFLDIRATVQRRMPDFELLKQIADECFMPLSYGGGIVDFDTAKRILSIGFEKIVMNSSTFSNPSLIQDVCKHFGSQAVIGAIDIKKNFWGGYHCYTESGTSKINIDVLDWALKLESLGVGELMVTSIYREGTWSGYDIDMINRIANSVKIPVIANGGAGSSSHISDIKNKTGIQAMAVGSSVVYQQKDMGVLINFPYM
jgi:imidazole glycerol-phosphate synthase subunit HisF